MDSKALTALAPDDALIKMHAQNIVLELLKLELAHEIWKLPAQAKRLEAMEARYDALLAKVLSAFSAKSESAATEPVEKPATATDKDNDELF